MECGVDNVYCTSQRAYFITQHVDCVVENADASNRELHAMRYDATF